MIEVKVYYGREGNTLTVWFGDPADEALAVSQREYVAEETGEELS